MDRLFFIHDTYLPERDPSALVKRFLYLSFLFLLAESNLIYFGALAAGRDGLVLNQHSQPSEGRERGNTSHSSPEEPIVHVKDGT